ncbi:hypothetical protein PFISCL1PPCAC_16531, partial [Pristionchus fissidentatus]
SIPLAPIVISPNPSLSSSPSLETSLSRAWLSSESHPLSSCDIAGKSARNDEKSILISGCRCSIHRLERLLIVGGRLEDR